MSLSRLFSSFSRVTGRALLASVILPATLVPGQGGSSAPSHKESLAVLPLPHGARIRSSDTFGEGAAPGHYYFLENGDRLRLFSLTLTHPMGARDLWMESWRPIRVPALRGQERLRTAAVGMSHLFLAGEEAGGTPFIRSYQIGFKDPDAQTKPILMGRVDYFPEADMTPVRRLYFDQKSRTLWLAYDSGRIESGNPYLVLHDRILWTDPAGYLPLPSETALSKGPSPLLTPRSLSRAPDACFSCRYYLVSRTEPKGQSRPSLPVRAPESLDSTLGMLPLGGGNGPFHGAASLCLSCSRSRTPRPNQGMQSYRPQGSSGGGHLVGQSPGLPLSSRPIFLCEEPMDHYFHQSGPDRRWTRESVPGKKICFPEPSLNIRRTLSLASGLRPSSTDIVVRWP